MNGLSAWLVEGQPLQNLIIFHWERVPLPGSNLESLALPLELKASLVIVPHYVLSSCCVTRGLACLLDESHLELLQSRLAPSVYCAWQHHAGVSWITAWILVFVSGTAAGVICVAGCARWSVWPPAEIVPELGVASSMSVQALAAAPQWGPRGLLAVASKSRLEFRLLLGGRQALALCLRL